jgi:magnesium transporter
LEPGPGGKDERRGENANHFFETLDMMNAFVLTPQEPTRSLTDLNELEQVWKDPGAIAWIDFDSPSAEELARLDTIVDVDDSALESCLSSEEHRPRVEEFTDHIFLLLYGVLSMAEDPTFAPRPLAVFCGKRFLVTIHRDSHRTINALRLRCQNNGEHILSRGVDFVLYSLVDGLVDNYGIALSDFHEQLDELEEESLNSGDDAVFSRAIQLRRELLELRRLAMAQREVIGPLARGECDYVAKTLGRRFSHISSHLTKTIELSDSLREILSSVRENYQFTLTRRTNEIMKTLTIFASIVLPLSFIASVYGMNLQTVPHIDDPWGFWVVLMGMGVVGLSLWIYFRGRNWF